ncbi:MAG: hypothetical protein P1U75_16610 [Antarcticimicrobium sp.]|nr:hypothetical protein [Antarcticimicrobium sp.]MDF1718277.1 hypothetical protein [Antarcticimicrobium sp.]
MTDRLALALGLMILSALVIDLALFGSGHMIFLAKKLFELTEWMAFWR